MAAPVEGKKVLQKLFLENKEKFKTAITHYFEKVNKVAPRIEQAVQGKGTLTFSRPSSDVSHHGFTFSAKSGQDKSELNAHVAQARMAFIGDIFQEIFPGSRELKVRQAEAYLCSLVADKKGLLPISFKTVLDNILSYTDPNMTVRRKIKVAEHALKVSDDAGAPADLKDLFQRTQSESTTDLSAALAALNSDDDGWGDSSTGEEETQESKRESALERDTFKLSDSLDILRRLAREVTLSNSEKHSESSESSETAEAETQVAAYFLAQEKPSTWKAALNALAFESAQLKKDLVNDPLKAFQSYFEKIFDAAFPDTAELRKEFIKYIKEKADAHPEKTAPGLISLIDTILREIISYANEDEDKQKQAIPRLVKQDQVGFQEATQESRHIIQNPPNVDLDTLWEKVFKPIERVALATNHGVINLDIYRMSLYIKHQFDALTSKEKNGILVLAEQILIEIEASIPSVRDAQKRAWAHFREQQAAPAVAAKKVDPVQAPAPADAEDVDPNLAPEDLPFLEPTKWTSRTASVATPPAQAPEPAKVASVPAANVATTPAPAPEPAKMASAPAANVAITPAPAPEPAKTASAPAATIDVTPVDQQPVAAEPAPEPASASVTTSQVTENKPVSTSETPSVAPTPTSEDTPAVDQPWYVRLGNLFNRFVEWIKGLFNGLFKEET